MPSESNNKALAGGVAAILLIAGGAVWYDRTQGRSSLQDAAIVVDERAPVGVETADTDAAEVTLETEAAEVTPETAPDVSTTAAEIGSMAPSIDTFFRNPDDTTVIAGRATPGQTVAIMLGGEELDRVVTDGDGAFGAVVFIAAADQPRRLRLIGDPDGDAVASAESVIVPPSAPVAVAATPPAPQTSTEIATAEVSGTSPVVSSEPGAPVVVTADVTGGTAPDVETNVPASIASDLGDTPAVFNPPTLIADADGVRVIQPAETTTTQPAFTDNIALDTITYDPTGEVLLAGRGAEAGGFVQIYLDNKPITTSRITADGGWQIDLPNVDTGIYTLRVDEVDQAGNVQSRIETPFKREEAADVAAILAEETSVDGFDIAVKTVQPGATLWAIAEEQFGDGIMYVNVFEANRDQIRNPDLIYPGQVFRLPELSE